MPGWRQIFVDDFATDVPLGSFPTALFDRWGGYPEPSWGSTDCIFHDTSGNGWYCPQKVVSIRGGLMDLYLHTETVGGTPRHLVAAPQPKLPGRKNLTQLYGRYAMRFRADALHGYKTAWLLWPASGNWPADGEIDFPESGLDQAICAFMHRQGASSPSDQDAACTGSRYPTWHTAVIEWTPSVTRFILDGRVILAPTKRIPNSPMRWVLQTETALGGVGPANSTAGHVQLDWVAAYAPA